MKWLLRAALWFAFGHGLIAACGDAAVLDPRAEGEEDETGGTGGTRGDPPPPGKTGGRTGGGGGKVSPPVPITGGRFGAGGSPVPGAGGSPTKPEPCDDPVAWTPQAFCASYPTTCDLSAQSCATPSDVKTFTEQGCGYVRLSRYYMSGLTNESIYDQFSWRLVYQRVTDTVCGDLIEVGTLPNCFNWMQVPCGSWWSSRDAGSGPIDASTRD